MPPPATSIPSRLLLALSQIASSKPRIIASPSPAAAAAGAGAARRASVAIIIRLRPEPSSASAAASPASSGAPSPVSTSPFVSQTLPLPNASGDAAAGPSVEQEKVQDVSRRLERFFAQDWVQKEGTRAEILFIKRATRATDKWSGHVAFPGGRQEPDDEDSRYTAMRETWEEVGLDLAEKEWLSVGALDDREITSSLGAKLLMVLSPHVFLSTSKDTPSPELQESEVASAHWVPIEALTGRGARYDSVAVDISTRLAPKNALARRALQLLIGSMQFKCILLPNEPIATGAVPLPTTADGRPLQLPDLKLWGLTLGMTLDLLSSMSLPSDVVGTGKSGKSSGDLSTYPHAMAELEQQQHKVKKSAGVVAFAPSMASIFPRFTYPDINLLIWIFGFRYRRTLKQNPASASRARVNWAGMSIGSYYAAVRRALVVAVVLRAIAALSALGWGVLALRKRLQQKRALRL